MQKKKINDLKGMMTAMNLVVKQPNEEYRLIMLEEQHIQTFYQWNAEEKHYECYTCRPVRKSQTLEEYSGKIQRAVYEQKDRIYVLVKADDNSIPLGKITLFDLNTRNHSAEFGYYLPEKSRGQGLGKIMLSLFLDDVFKDEDLNLNKIYATTASNNVPSINLLEKFSFQLDGKLREHYWIGENKYDQLVFSLLKREWKE